MMPKRRYINVRHYLERSHAHQRHRYVTDWVPDE